MSVLIGGPWKRSFEIDLRDLECMQRGLLIRAANRNWVAIVVQDGDGIEARNDRGRLIAAAPDLLTAAKAMMAIADPDGDATDIWAVDMRAAIKKAEGGE